MRYRQGSMVALWVILAIVVAACAGETADTTSAGGGTTPTTASGGTTTTPAAGTGVNIGVLAPLTGELGAFGEIVAKGYELAAQQINETGQLACGPIELFVADSKTNPEVGIREAQQMIDNENVVAIVGSTSETVVALVDMAETEEVVLMSPYAGSISLNDLGGNYVYRTVASDLDDGKAAGRWLAQQEYGSILVMTQNEESTISIGTAAADVARTAGLNVVDEVVYNPGQPSYQAELSGVLAAPPEVIFLAGGQESGATIIREARDLGYTGEWLLSADMAVPEIFEAVDPADLNDSAYAEFGNPDTTLPEFQAFGQAYTEVYDEDPGPFASNAWDGMNLIALAMVSSGECTGAGINGAIRDVSSGGTAVTTFADGAEALAAGKDIDYQGASGPVDLDDTGSVLGSYSIVGAQNGDWVEVQFYSSADIAG